MLHELRIYHAMPGRLPDLNKRFDTITLKIWEKHGIKQVGFWTTVFGPSNQILYYLLEWESLAHREKVWNAFQADPEWHTKRAETEKNGPLVAHLESYMLQPTSYSKLK
jgi:NIPSNAP